MARGRTLGAVLLTLVSLGCAHAQLPLVGPQANVPETWPATFHPVPEFWMDVGLRNVLAHAWSDSVGQHERGWCAAVAVKQDTSPASPVFTVVGLVIAVPLTSTPSSIRFNCPTGMMMLHIHPPHTRYALGDSLAYYAGGLEAYECWPSLQDQLTLFLRLDPLALIQCDRNSVTVYWNPNYLGQLAKLQDARRDSLRFARMPNLPLR